MLPGDSGKVTRKQVYETANATVDVVVRKRDKYNTKDKSVKSKSSSGSYMSGTSMGGNDAPTAALQPQLAVPARTPVTTGVQLPPQVAERGVQATEALKDQAQIYPLLEPNMVNRSTSPRFVTPEPSPTRVTGTNGSSHQRKRKLPWWRSYSVLKVLILELRREAKKYGTGGNEKVNQLIDTLESCIHDISPDTINEQVRNYHTVDSQVAAIIQATAGTQVAAGSEMAAGILAAAGREVTATGIQGAAGSQAAAGSQVATGSQVAAGIQAATGSPAAAGVQAATGTQAAAGSPAATGIQAAAGIQAATGIEAATGIQAAAGIEAATGIQAAAGSQAAASIQVAAGSELGANAEVEPTESLISQCPSMLQLKQENEEISRKLQEVKNTLNTFEGEERECQEMVNEMKDLISKLTEDNTMMLQQLKYKKELQHELKDALQQNKAYKAQCKLLVEENANLQQLLEEAQEKFARNEETIPKEVATQGAASLPDLEGQSQWMSNYFLYLLKQICQENKIILELLSGRKQMKEALVTVQQRSKNLNEECSSLARQNTEIRKLLLKKHEDLIQQQKTIRELYLAIVRKYPNLRSVPVQDLSQRSIVILDNSTDRVNHPTLPEGQTDRGSAVDDHHTITDSQPGVTPSNISTNNQISSSATAVEIHPVPQNARNVYGCAGRQKLFQHPCDLSVVHEELSQIPDNPLHAAYSKTLTSSQTSGSAENAEMHPASQQTRNLHGGDVTQNLSLCQPVVVPVEGEKPSQGFGATIIPSGTSRHTSTRSHISGSAGEAELYPVSPRASSRRADIVGKNLSLQQAYEPPAADVDEPSREDVLLCKSMLLENQEYVAPNYESPNLAEGEESEQLSDRLFYNQVPSRTTGSPLSNRGVNNWSQYMTFRDEVGLPIDMADTDPSSDFQSRTSINNLRNSYIVCRAEEAMRNNLPLTAPFQLPVEDLELLNKTFRFLPDSVELHDLSFQSLLELYEFFDSVLIHSDDSLDRTIDLSADDP